jgi:hypothetical protein
VKRTVVRHRDAQEDVALALDIPHGPPPTGRLRGADLHAQARTLVEQLDDPAVDGVDTPPEPPKLGRLRPGP